MPEIAIQQLFWHNGPMITEATVQAEIWPVVQRLITATMQGDEKGARRELVPNRPVAAMLDLFGLTSLDIFLKTILLQENFALRQAILTEGGRFVYLEYVWLGEEPAGSDIFPAAQMVTIKLRRYRERWRIDDINPSSIEMLLSAPRARAVLLLTPEFQQSGAFPQAPWILPLALYSGLLQLPMRDEAITDPVEALFLTQMQTSGYEVMALVLGQRLWRDYKRKRKLKKVPASEQTAYAAALEFIMSEQTASELALAPLCEAYDALLPVADSFVRRIKGTLKLKEIDERYTTLFNEEVRVSG